MIDKDNTVFAALLHGTRWAGGHTPRVLAMITGHKDIGRSRQAANVTGADLQNLAQPRSDGQVLIGLALNFT
jgi:hypothetical protein